MHPEESLNIVQIFLQRVSRFKNRTALLSKDSPGGNYVSLSWSEWAERVKHAALGLDKAGIHFGDRVGILSENRPEWTVADLGILSLGAVTVPIYPTSSVQDIDYLIRDAGIEILFVSTAEQRNRIAPVLENSQIGQAILFDNAALCSTSGSKMISMQALLEQGRIEDQKNRGLYDSKVNAVKPEDLATLIYTSGTTGPPKGVMLTHHNFIANYLGASEFIRISDSDRALSFLPLSHVFERLAGYYFMVAHGATIAYAENMQTVAEDMALVRPTIAAAVPRFYEKVYAKLMEKVQSSSPLQQKIFHWAVAVGKQYAQKSIEKKSPSFFLRMQYHIAKWLVFKKIKAKLGGRLRFFISGGAPLSKELAEFFYAADILILEGYGLTETSPVIAVNCPEAFRFGTVGKILKNVEVKIAEDGEILTRGPCVMKGYFKNPGATAEAVQGGWFHTGDIGQIDADGFLKITDRKKDIIATSGGKKVSPQNIEGLLLGDPLFSQAVVLGDKRNYLVALIYPNRKEVEDYARKIGISDWGWERLLQDPRILEWAGARLRERIQHLAPFEQIKYFTFLSKELSQENGELTPTLKVRRKIVMEKYRDFIEKMYEKGSEIKAPLPSS